MKKGFFLSVLLLSVLAAALALSGCSSVKATVDFEKCVNMEFSGFDGEGEARVKLDDAYALSLLGDMNMASAAAVLRSFSVHSHADNGSLSNGDVVTVTVDTDPEILKNSKVAVKNTELEFIVSGLEEKPQVDAFDGLKVTFDGISPFCRVDIAYEGGNPQINTSYFGIVLPDGKKSGSLANGDKVTVEISEYGRKVIGELGDIKETSREYTVQADKSYILSAADLDTESREKLISSVTAALPEKLAALDDTSKLSIVSGLSGIDAFTVSMHSHSVKSIENIAYDSGYAGIEVSKSTFGVTKENRFIYLFYTADISYSVRDGSSMKEEELNGAALIVRLTDATISSSGEISYSALALGARRDIQTAYDSKITSDFTGIS